MSCTYRPRRLCSVSRTQNHENVILATKLYITCIVHLC